MKRVMIARDVLEHIKAGKAVPSHNGYLRVLMPGRGIPNLFSDMEGMKSARDVFTQPGVICQVCAIGAVAHSYITNFNGFTLNNAIYVDSKTKQLVRIFGKDLLSVIEAVYEGWAFDKVYVSYSPYMFESQADVPMDIYNRSFKSQTIESIMKNNIRNNGKYNYNGIMIG